MDYLAHQSQILTPIISYMQHRTKSELTSLLPKLTNTESKGANGTIGVIGGSIEYTGAPYYAAMAALKMGADLAHVFCSRDAAIPIKTYSPQLIVHPVFYYDENSDQWSNEEMEVHASKWVAFLMTKASRISCWVVGPGLGRHHCLSLFFAKFIQSLPQKSYLVIDADGLFFLTKHPNLIEPLQKHNCILTPNSRQFAHLNKLLNLNEALLSQIQQTHTNTNTHTHTNTHTQQIITTTSQTKSDHPISTIIKGQMDLIVHKGNQITTVHTEGGLKRCGGIGDVLAGCLASCYFWDSELGPLLACYTVKLAAARAYQLHGRSLTGKGVLDQVEHVVKSFG